MLYEPQRDKVPRDRFGGHFGAIAYVKRGEGERWYQEYAGADDT